MTNDIEAAARALDYYQGLARERGAQYALDTAIDDIVKLRAALAEAPAPARRAKGGAK